MKEISKSEQEWRAKLPAEVFRVTRQKETEPPFSGKFWNHKETGVYRCVCCASELFCSKAKYDSGAGWPSFSEPIGKDSVQTEEDRSQGMFRTEVLCARCGAHLGHVFPDGPKPTGLRYCINSLSLKFSSEK